MDWNIVSENTEEIIDKNPDIYVKRAERALGEGNIERAIKEVDTAIQYCDLDKKVHYLFEKAKVIYGANKNYECCNLIEEHLKEFYNYFNLDKFKEVLNLLNKTADYSENKIKSLLNEKNIPLIFTGGYNHISNSYRHFELEAENYKKNKDYERCMQSYENAIKANNEKIDAYKRFIRDCELALWAIAKAQKGDAKAQYDVGIMYEIEFYGVVKDDKEAVKWHRKAAEQGYARAQTRLGVMYDYGKGITENKQEAFKWYKKSTEQGNSSARHYLGLMYEASYNNQQARIEYKKEILKILEDSQKGNSEEQYNLGFMYTYGSYVVAKDEKEAAKWYEKAAEQGHAKAQLYLGFMYNRGRGVPENKQEAFKWYKKSAEQGNLAAQHYLNLLMYESGEITKENN